MSAERDTYYRVLHEALGKGMSDHDARRAAYIASQQHKTKPTKKGRKR